MLRIFALLVFSAGLAASSPRAQAACISDWSVAAPIVERERLVTVESLSRIAADKVAGSVIVRTALCEEKGTFLYRIVVRDSHGQLSTRTVDARAPFK